MKITFSIILLLIVLLLCREPNGSISDFNQKSDLIKIAARVYQSGLTQGNGGDISARVPETDRMIIKATGSSLGDLDYKKLITTDLHGTIIDGSLKPSQETEIHQKIYLLRKDVGAIMHMHSPYATAWATVGKMIPIVTQQAVPILKNAAIVPYYPVGSKELVDSIIQKYQNPDTRIVFMENHGTFVVGSDLYDLLYKAEVVESTAKIAILCQALGSPKPM